MVGFLVFLIARAEEPLFAEVKTGALRFAVMMFGDQLVGVPTNGLAGEHGEGAAVLAG
jgi:hypothetical protein